MILRDRDRTVDPCCDNVVGLAFSDLWPAISFILCFVYFDHNDRSASTRCPRWPRSSTRTTSLHSFTKCDCVNKFFFLTEGNKKNIDSQGEIRFSVFCHTYTVTLRQGFWDYSPGISKKNDTVVPFLLHTLNIVLSCTLDTNSPSRFSKDDAAKPACHEFCSAGSDEKLGKHTR